MERETRVRQQENNAGQQQPEFAMRRNPLHAQSTSNGGTTANELSSNTVDPFLSAAASAAATAAAVAHVNGTGNGAATNIPQPSTAPPSSLATDFHARQESADSGLGMGSNFNLGSIPEDIPGMEGLDSMDTDLDTTLTDPATPTPTTTLIGCGMQQQQQQQQVVDGSSMDSSETMIPNLQAELGGDFLDFQTILTSQNQVNPNEGPLTWL